MEPARGSDGRRLFTAEFKREQIDRLLRGEVTASELSRELGIARSLVQRWKYLATKGAEAAVSSNDEVVPVSALRGDTDIEYQLWDIAPTFITTDGRLKPEFAQRGIKLERSIDPEIIYLYFNMQDKTVGGLGKEKIALRRAIAMAYKVEDQIRIIRKGQSIRAQYPIPPGVAGHDPEYRSSIGHDPRAANALLDKFAYRKGADGFRRLPPALSVNRRSIAGVSHSTASRSPSELTAAGAPLMRT